ncbi:MAG: TMEM175 family protein [Woeseiaceae bacterium]
MSSQQINNPLNDTVFKDRGSETTRLETFVDAAFAFALTLLVISFDAVPASYQELVLALKKIPAFLFGFLVLMMFWVAHRNWSKRYGLDTTFSVLISLTLIFIILVYVYPLRAMATAAVSAMTNGWLPTDFDVRTGFEALGLFRIYAIGFLLCNACLAALNYHALKLKDALQLDPAEVFLTRVEVVAWMIVGSFGLASLISSFVVSERWIGFCGWIYAGLAIAMPLLGRITEARFADRFPEHPAARR